MSRTREWALLAAVVILAAVAVRLGVWQLDRLGIRRAANSALQAARSMPALDLETTPPAAGRMAEARGQFEASGEVLLRSRVHRAAPGLHVVTPFRLAGGGAQVIWVLRGFLPAADGVSPDSVPTAAPGIVTIRGELHPLPSTRDGGQPVSSRGDTTWRRLDAAVAQQRRPDAPPLMLYLEGDAGGPGRLATVEPPLLDDGPHLSYALQWFAIALAILAFGAYVLRKRAGRGRVPSAAAP